MARVLYIIAPGTPITTQVIADADAAGASEIAQGIPSRLEREGVTGTYPFTYTEPDDPERSGLILAVAVLRNQLGTMRTPNQINNALDAITVILRRLARAEMDRT